MAYTHIKPGEEIEVSAHVYSSYVKNVERISELVKLSIPELGTLREASEEAENAIFAKFDAIVKEWTAQAEETVMLRAALKYRATPVANHTANKQVIREYDWHEISNMVYKFRWRTHVCTRYDRDRKKDMPYAWEVSWYVQFNTPTNPDNQQTGWQIAGQSQKRFPDEASMEKYLQGRIAAYAHLFTELSPPIPKGEESRFSVHGVLLPGYTVEVPEPTIEERVESLLAFAEDTDLSMPAQPSPAPSKKPPPHKPKKHTPTR